MEIGAATTEKKIMIVSFSVTHAQKSVMMVVRCQTTVMIVIRSVSGIMRRLMCFVLRLVYFSQPKHVRITSGRTITTTINQ